MAFAANQPISLYLLGRYADIHRNFLRTDQEQSAQRLRHRHWLSPVPSPDLLDRFQVPPADPQNHGLRRNGLRASPLQEGAELAEGPGAGVIEWRHVFSHVLEAIHKHANIRKLQIPRDFREERGLLDARFDQEKLQIWTHNLHGEAGKAAARTNVGEPTVFHRHSHRGIHAFAEMTI